MNAPATFTHPLEPLALAVRRGERINRTDRFDWSEWRDAAEYALEGDYDDFEMMVAQDIASETYDATAWRAECRGDYHFADRTDFADWFDRDRSYWLSKAHAQSVEGMVA